MTLHHTPDPPACAQDPARVRLHEEMTRLTKRINVSNIELDNLGKASKAQTKKLNKLCKDLAALQEERVRQGGAGQAGACSGALTCPEPDSDNVIGSVFCV